MKNTILFICLLFLFAILAVSSLPQHSGTCDEIAHHIPMGYMLLTGNFFKLDTSHPPLPRYIVAAPLKLLMNINAPLDKLEEQKLDRSRFGRDFFYVYNKYPLKILFVSRLAVVFIGILCGIILFIWTKFLYGNNAALLSLFLYTFSPNIIANATISTTDMVATCFILLSVSTFWLFVKTPSFKNTCIAGFCLGLAQLSKYTALLLYPMFFSLLLFEFSRLIEEKRKNIMLAFFAVVAISILIIWAGYSFELKPILSGALNVQEKLGIAHSIFKKIFIFASENSLAKLDYFLLNIPVPLGTHVLGILGILRHNYEGHMMYFLGSWSKHGHPLYFLIAFLIKTPIPLFIFLIAGSIAVLKNKLQRNEIFIISTILLFFITASLSKLQLGLRYILPIYPFCFILAARGIEFMKGKFYKLITFLLMMWYAFSAFSAWPNYISYFNEFIGGADNGWRYLRDSDIDWGQDLPALAHYMERNHIKEITFKYFGQDNPFVYGINFKEFSEQDFRKPANKIYAISAQHLEAIPWAKSYIPTAKAGYSIFIYDFRL